jgi:hypothetical protein
VEVVVMAVVAVRAEVVAMEAVATELAVRAGSREVRKADKLVAG